MAAEDDDLMTRLRAALATARDVIDRAGRVEMPTTLRAARRARWEWADFAEVYDMPWYDADVMAADSRRVMTLGRALSIIDEMEDALIREIVLRPDNLVSQLKAGVDFGVSVALIFLKGIWKFGVRRSFLRAVWELVLHACLILGSSTMVKVVKTCITVRESYDPVIVKAALPQRTGPRFRVRREARGRARVKGFRGRQPKGTVA